MIFPTLFKRRSCYFPTMWGSLIIVITLVMLGGFVVKNFATFLALNVPISSRYLVVEGWLSKVSLEQAVVEFRRGNYELIITSGGPDLSDFDSTYESYAEKATAELIKIGVEPSKIISAPSPASAQDRTYLSAVMVRNKLLEHLKFLPESINVFSSDVHSRRSYYLYELAFRNTETKIGIVATDSERFNLDSWWQTSEGAKSVLTEMFGWLWTRCCFAPHDVGSYGEMWGQKNV
ncbi:hypothetical protein LCGC14_0480360 [marine sediment metagenome]|uniref:Uncharacterized protein n=1 Tax=marine sediment metagenome TaxID=412755 RepID=A0A0F9VI96_9ZZZZ|nr:hypothetical protein [Methylophaga sp.]HEC58014.1 hypothetical protein [Methylophaga sp.]